VRTKNKGRYKWLLLVRKETRDPRVPDFGHADRKYRIVRTSGTADPYIGFKLVGTFDTEDEAKAMRKLAED
jgi:hypothetical protein